MIAVVVLSQDTLLGMPLPSLKTASGNKVTYRELIACRIAKAQKPESDRHTFLYSIL